MSAPLAPNRHSLLVMARRRGIANGEWRTYRFAQTLEHADRIIDETEERPTDTEYRVAVEHTTFRWLCDACQEPSCSGCRGWDDGETP